MEVVGIEGMEVAKVVVVGLELELVGSREGVVAVVVVDTVVVVVVETDVVVVVKQSLLLRC